MAESVMRIPCTEPQLRRRKSSCAGAGRAIGPSGFPNRRSQGVKAPTNRPTFQLNRKSPWRRVSNPPRAVGKNPKPSRPGQRCRTSPQGCPSWAPWDWGLAHTPIRSRNPGMGGWSKPFHGGVPSTRVISPDLPTARRRASHPIPRSWLKLSARSQDTCHSRDQSSGCDPYRPCA